MMKRLLYTGIDAQALVFGTRLLVEVNGILRRDGSVVAASEEKHRNGEGAAVVLQILDSGFSFRPSWV